jgi:tetratricopeptide (TPR) repeat protein
MKPYGIRLCAGSLACLGASAQTSAGSPAKTSCALRPASSSQGDASLKAEDFAAANTFFQSQTAGTAATEDDWAGRVHAEIELNKFADALTSAKQAVALFPKSPLALAALGDAEYRAADFDNAEKDYTRAIALDACSPEAHLGAGRILLLYSQYGSAIRQLALAHRLAPANDAISEALFEQLPSGMRAQGLGNLLKSSQGLSAAHHQRLEQEAALAAMHADSRLTEIVRPTAIDLLPLYVDGKLIRDYGLKIKTPGGSLAIDLDSTAEGILLTKKDAARLGVVPAIAAETTPPYLGYVDSLQVGPVHFGRTAVKVVSDAVLAKDGYSVISLGFFHDALIHIDWNAKQMTLTPYAGPSQSPDALQTNATAPDSEHTWARVLVDRQRMLMLTLLENKPAGYFVADTSFMLDTVSNAIAQNKHRQKDNTLHLYGIDGPLVRLYVKAGGANSDVTDFSDETGREEPVRFIDEQVNLRYGGIAHVVPTLWNFDLEPMSHALGIEVSGLIGFRVLQQYYLDFDYRNGYVHMLYDANFELRRLTLENR